MAKMPSSTQRKDKTPAKFVGPVDARQQPNAGVYPNYYSHKTRSGHVFMMDDSKHGEHITLQHRSGSMVQFLPDGAVQFISHNGRYQFTFGEDRVMITGAQDIVVQGAASLRVEKDYNMTVMGDMNTTVDGNFNMTAKNFHADIGGNIDWVAKNMTTKIEGATEMSSHKTTTISSDGGLALSSTDSSVGIMAKESVGIKAYEEVMIESDAGTYVKSGEGVNIESEDSTNIKAGSALNLKADGKLSIQGDPVAIDGSQILLNSGASVAADGSKDAEVSFGTPSDANTDRVRNAEIFRVHVGEDNGIDAEIENTTLEQTDDIFSEVSAAAEVGVIALQAINPNRGNAATIGTSTILPPR